MGELAALPRSCPRGICDGSGWTYEDGNVARPCECREQRISQARARGVNSVIPKKYRGVSFDRPPVATMNPDYVASVAEYVDDLSGNLANGAGMWFFGDVGTGKTTLAMLVSKLAIESGHTVAIYSLPKLLATIRQTFSAEGDADSHLQFFERLVSVDLLHIDDLGAEKSSEWVLEQLYVLVNERYELGKSIVVTTNLDREDLESQIGERTVSRLAQICSHFMVPMHGTDARVQVHPLS